MDFFRVRLGKAGCPRDDPGGVYGLTPQLKVCPASDSCLHLFRTQKEASNLFPKQNVKLYIKDLAKVFFWGGGGEVKGSIETDTDKRMPVVELEASCCE